MAARLLTLWCLWSFSAFAAGKVLVTTATRVGLNEKIAHELLTRVESALTQEGLVVKRVEQSCDGERACLVELGAKEAQDAVVAVSLVMSLKSIIVDLEAVSTASGTVLSQTNFKLKGPDGVLPQTVTVFAHGIEEQLEAEAKLKRLAVDAPTRTVLEPPPPTPSLNVPLTPSPSRTPVTIASLGAGAALVAAIVLFGVGASQQSQLPPRESMLTALAPERAQQLVDGANTAYTGSAIAGGAAGALGITAIILAVTSK